MDLRRQLAVLRAWLWLLILSVVLAGGAAFLVSSVLPKSYESRVTLLVGQSLSSSNPDYNQLLASQRLSQTYASVATTRPLAEKVIETLRLPLTPDQLVQKVSASTPLNSSLVYVAATDGDPARAAAIANALAAALVTESPSVQGVEGATRQAVDADLRSTRDAINVAQKQLDTLVAATNPSSVQLQQMQTLQTRLATLRSTYATLLSYSASNASNALSIVDPAVASISPSSPRPLLNTVLAALLALLAALGIAFLVEYLDDSVKSPEDLREVADVATLGTLPILAGDPKRDELYRLVTLLYPKAPAAEAYRTLRTNLEFTSVDKPVRTLLVTSSVPQEGKTTTAANLAIAFAQAGHSVLLVDCDMRKPAVHRLFGLENRTGVSALFRGHDRVPELLQLTEQPNLWILTSGPIPPNPAELLGSRRMAELLPKFTDLAEIVIFDSPPLQAVTDAAVLAAQVDGVLLVVGAGKTRRAAIQHGREALAMAGAHILGVALNRMKAGGSAGGYYYYHYYGEGSTGPSDGGDRKRGGSRRRASGVAIEPATAFPDD